MVKRTRRLSAAAILLLLAAACAGCMYQGEIERNQANPLFIREEIDRVAAAVSRFYDARGVYPIQTQDASTPEYEKFRIDLDRLVRLKMLSSIPANAFETGGHYYYLLVHPETEPTVMLMDLTAMQRIGDLQRAIDGFAAGSGGRLPLGLETAPGFYAIDFEALKQKPLQIHSPYSGQYLPVLLHESGQALIDYSLDIMKAVRETEPLAEGADPRSLLAKASPIAPVRSFPYAWRNGEPVLVAP